MKSLSHPNVLSVKEIVYTEGRSIVAAVARMCVCVNVCVCVCARARVRTRGGRCFSFSLSLFRSSLSLSFSLSLSVRVLRPPAVSFTHDLSFSLPLSLPHRPTRNARGCTVLTRYCTPICTRMHSLTCPTESKDDPQGSIFLVFEFMDHDLGGLLNREVKFTVPEVMCLTEQILTGPCIRLLCAVLSVF